MQKFQDIVLRADGRPASGATVTVTTAAGDAATLYSGNREGLLESNTITTSRGGIYSFYADNGRYTVTVSQDGFVTETRTDVLLFDPAEGAEDVSFVQSGSGAIERSAQDKMRESVSVKDFGAAGDGATDDSAEIQLPMTAGRTHLPRGTYRLGAPLLYRKDQLITGEGKSFAGTVLRPTGDFSALMPSGEVPAIDYAKNTFKDLQIDAAAITSDFAIKVDRCYLTEYENLWIRNSYKGVSVTNSDAITFKNLMVMEDSDSDAVLVGDYARSIKFIACNFEKNPGNTEPGGVVRIDGTSVSAVSGADFIGCQIERGGLYVVRGEAKWYGGKMVDSKVTFYPRARDCWVNASHYGSTNINDFGMNTVVENAFCTNMATARHEWPRLVSASASSLTYGAAAEEYLYLVSASRVPNTAGTNCQIEIKEGATVLAASPLFDLPAAGNTVGMSKKDAYTFLAGVRNVAAASGPVFTNCSGVSIRGGKNLLTNGTFNAGASTGWSFDSASSSASGDDILITPSDSSWGIYQDISAATKYGKRYIVAAKFSGAAHLHLGSAWNGTAGARPLMAEGVPDLYGDGDTVAMISFEHASGLPNRVSLGSLASSAAVTVRWIMLIECE